MLAPWVLDRTEEPTTNRYPTNWPREDARKLDPVPFPRPGRDLREREDDPRSEFIGAYLERAI